MTRDNGMLRRLEREGDWLNRHEVAVGFPAKASGGWSNNENADVLDHAEFNEFGTVNIPSRPFMRTTEDLRGGEAAQLMAAQVGAITDGNLSGQTALDRIGDWYRGAIQETITSYDWTPNAPSTIAKKGSDKPLIDTGRMRAAVTWLVRGRE